MTPYCAPFNGKYEHVSCVVLRNGAVVSFALVLLCHCTTCTYNAIHNSFIRSSNYLQYHIYKENISQQHGYVTSRDFIGIKQFLYNSSCDRHMPVRHNLMISPYMYEIHICKRKFVKLHYHLQKIMRKIYF